MGPAATRLSRLYPIPLISIPAPTLPIITIVQIAESAHPSTT